MSTEPWAIEYTSRIKDLIKNAFIKTHISYFFDLSILCTGSIEIAVIVVIANHRRSDRSADKDQLWWDWFEPKSFECAQMVKLRASIEGEIFPCN